MSKHPAEHGAGESAANDVMMRSGPRDCEHVEQIDSHLGHTQTHKHASKVIPPTWPGTTPVLIRKHVDHSPRTWAAQVFP